MSQSNLLILNTAATFLRQGITIVIALLVTRLGLAALGATDYGLLMVLGASGGLIALLHNAIAVSAQRHLAYEIGLGDPERIRATFSTVSAVYIILTLIVLALGISLSGPIVSILSIPPERHDAAHAAFLWTIATVAGLVFTTPHRALLLAQQSIVFFTVFELLGSSLRLVAVLIVMQHSGDRLVALAGLFFAASFLTFGALSLLTTIKQREARLSPRRVQRHEIRRLFAYAGWSTLGAMSWRVRAQGAQIALNLLFGPVVNAAYGVALQVAGYQSQISQAISRAARPVIIGAEARKERRIVHLMSLRTTKYLAILTGAFVALILVEADGILRLWLGRDLPWVATLTRITVVSILIREIGQGFVLAMHAVGEIALQSAVILSLELLFLALGVAVSLLPGGSPWIIPAAAVLGGVCITTFHARHIGGKIDMPARRWINDAILPAAFVFGAAMAAGATVAAIAPPTLWRLPATAAIIGAATILTTWFGALTLPEKRTFLRFASVSLRRASAPFAGRGA